jgi:hypothetical protein
LFGFSTMIGVRTHDWVVLMETWDPTSLSLNLHKIFLEHLENFSVMKTLKYTASLIMIARLHDSDFVNRM